MPVGTEYITGTAEMNSGRPILYMLMSPRGLQRCEFGDGTSSGLQIHRQFELYGSSVHILQLFGEGKGPFLGSRHSGT